MEINESKWTELQRTVISHFVSINLSANNMEKKEGYLVLILSNLLTVYAL